MCIPHSDVKENAYSTGDPGLIPGLGRSPGEGRTLEWVAISFSNA